MSKLTRFGKVKSAAVQQKTVVRFGDMPQMGRVKYPTVAVMSKREAMALGVPVMIRTEISEDGDLKMAIAKAVVKAGRMSPTGRVTLTGSGPFAVINGKKMQMAQLVTAAGQRGGYSRRVVMAMTRKVCAYQRHQGMRKLGVELETGPDGMPVIVIFSPTPEIPTYRVKHVVRTEDDSEDDEQKNGGGGGTPPSGDHLFLKEPWTDLQLIEAMKTAAHDLLDEGHKGQAKWEEDGQYHIRQFGDIQLLVCLFFYVYVHKMDSGKGFFYSQRNDFHQYCAKYLAKDFYVGCERNFRGCINKLQNRRHSFDEYIKEGVQPNEKLGQGGTSLKFWYKIYRQAAASFDKVFCTKVKA